MTRQPEKGYDWSVSTEVAGSTNEPDEGSRSTRYPDSLMPFVGSLAEHDQRFAELREELLLGYGYNTARAYRADLDDIHGWALERGLDVLQLTEKDVRRYVALLRRRKYSESTIRRRLTALRGLYDLGLSQGSVALNSARQVVSP